MITTTIIISPPQGRRKCSGFFPAFRQRVGQLEEYLRATAKAGGWSKREERPERCTLPDHHETRAHMFTHPTPPQSLPAPLHEKKPGPHISPSPTPYPNTCTNEPTHLTPTHLFTYSPTHLPTYPPTHLPTYPPTHLPTYPPTHLPTYPPTHLPTYPPTHLPTYPPTHLPTHTATQRRQPLPVCSGSEANKQHGLFGRATRSKS